MLNDLDSHNHAMGSKLVDVVQELIDLLGPTLVAVIGGVNETRAVAQWLKDRQPQRPQTLRFALQLARMVGSAGDPALVRAWFQGSNPHLNDKTPALLLRTEPLDQIQGPLMTAARQFAAR